MRESFYGFFMFFSFLSTRQKISSIRRCEKVIRKISKDFPLMNDDDERELLKKASEYDFSFRFM
jgi:hypothetical protein